MGIWQETRGMAFGRLLRRLSATRCWLWIGLATVGALPAEAAAPSRLTATSYGAAGEVAGSLHVLDTGNGRWMIDCGAECEEPAPSQAGGGTTPSRPKGGSFTQTLPAGIESATAVFLTHAHTDHLGRLPLLVDRGFTGPIYMTDATAALAGPMLRVLLQVDRATIRHWAWSKDRRIRAEIRHKSLYAHWRNCQLRQEIPADRIERATCSAQELFDRFGSQTPPVKVTLCRQCIEDEVAGILRHARPVKYDAAIEVAPGVRATFLDAGHIPGAASIFFEVTVGGTSRQVLFSGDLGNGLSPLLASPRPAPAADAVFVESTYGPIHRKASVCQQRTLFRRAVAEAIGQGGVTWIPCFALDRTQKILYELHLAQQDKMLPEPLPIYCPSPTAKDVTALYREHRQSWFLPAVAADANAFSPSEVHATVPSCKRLPRPCIIISTGDILIAPWMRKLLGELLPEPSTNLLLVGYQPLGSAGELLIHGATKLDIDGQTAAVRAKVRVFSCFSGHADAAEIDAWLSNVSKQSTIVLVHGDPPDLAARAEQLQRQGRRHVLVAKPGVPIDLPY
jgi:metallo-beta-lactamase family protein